MKKKIKTFLQHFKLLEISIRIYNCLGIFRGSLKDKLKFFNDYNEYKKQYKKDERNNFSINIREMYPMLKCYRQPSGKLDSHYFIQDLEIAKRIYVSGVDEHMDIGSRIDGFISHIAVFVNKVVVLDIRPNYEKIFNIEFKHEDATYLSGIPSNSVQSISSLHAIEHFGLGRYGDTINPNADIEAMKSLQRVLKKGGKLYFSVPCSGRERLEFNGFRVYMPITILSIFNELNLEEFMLINNFELYKNLNVHDEMLKTVNYGCGLFVFSK